MAEKHFIKFMTETRKILKEYSTIIIKVHDDHFSLAREKEAINKIRSLESRLDVLNDSIASFPHYDDQVLAVRHIKMIRNALDSTLCSLLGNIDDKDL